MLLFDMSFYSDQPNNHFLLLLTGILLDAVAGEMLWLFPRIPHPVVLIGLGISILEHKLNCPNYNSTNQRWMGFFTVAVMATVSVICGVLWHKLSIMLSYYTYGLVEIFLIGVLMAQRSLYQHVAAVASALAQEGLYGGQVAVAKLCGRDPSSLDEAGVIRAAIESCAENFNDGIVAPAFWYVLFDLPGLLVYKTVNTLDSMIGHCNKRYQSFGFAAARLDDLLNWIPARIAGLLIVSAAAFVPKARPLVAFVTMIHDARKHRSPNAGWTEAAMAGALGIALAGPRYYVGYKVEDAWLGASYRKEINIYDIGSALDLFLLACVIHAMVILSSWYAFILLIGYIPTNLAG